MSYSPGTPVPGSVAEFDLVLERPGRWILTGHHIPFGYRMARQYIAIGRAEFQAQGCEWMIIRIRNEWRGGRR